jgi:hypothetical protein
MEDVATSDQLPETRQQPEPMQVVTQPEPEKELYGWSAPSRPYKKRSREFYSTVAALVILLSVIFMFAKDFTDWGDCGVWVCGVCAGFGATRYDFSYDYQ